MTGILFTGFFAQRVWNQVSNGLLAVRAPRQLPWQGVAAVVGPAYAFAART
jgi:hypothetical protein